MVDDGLVPLLAEQVAYYRALAPEYLEGVLNMPGGEELEGALETFAPTGDVLELACGPGTWTLRLLRHAATVTAVDASPEMLAIAWERVGDDRVRFVLADLFEWRPDRRYDVVFFGFWLSHVPLERFAAFWALVHDCLAPHGRVFSLTTRTGVSRELVVAVGTPVARRPPRRSQRARLTHWAPALGGGGESLLGPWMHDAGLR